METYFLDLHVHIGKDSQGRPVKITASPQLTLPNILKECLEKKGIDLVGVVDCGTYGVLADLEEMLLKGELLALKKGGWRYRDKITLFAGMELETIEKEGGRAHYLCFFPHLDKLKDFSHYIWTKVKNKFLSSQVCYLTAVQLLKEVEKRDGLFIPAHVFTPYKSLYGNCAVSLKDVFGREANKIKVIELGLSADRKMALLLPELRDKFFLANSDAHSLDNIGREYNQVAIDSPTFKGLMDLFAGKSGKLIANYGLDPQLGKYHRSFCQRCNCSLLAKPPQLFCSKCGTSEQFVIGVLDRIVSVAEKQVNEKNVDTVEGTYLYQVPLKFLPGIGKVTLEKLLAEFGTEMRVLQQVSFEDLAKIVGAKLAALIIKSRQGTLKIIPGGGGIYGKIDQS